MLRETVPGLEPGAPGRAPPPRGRTQLHAAVYDAAIPLSFVRWWLACALYVLVAVMWLIPDRRIEHTLAE